MPIKTKGINHPALFGRKLDETIPNSTLKYWVCVWYCVSQTWKNPRLTHLFFSAGNGAFIAFFIPNEDSGLDLANGSEGIGSMQHLALNLDVPIEEAMETLKQNKIEIKGPIDRGYLLYTLIAFTVLLFIGSVIADGKNEYTLPSIQKEVNEFLNQRKEMSIDEADKSIMVKAARDLDRAMPSPGLRAGESAPDFTLFNAFGSRAKLSDHLKKGPVVLAFYRGAWCPFCNIELNVLQRSLSHFKEYNASLIAVTPQRPDKSKEQIKKAEYTFEVLSDLDNSVMKSYNLYFEVPRELHELYKT